MSGIKNFVVLALLLVAPASAATTANPSLWHIKSDKGEVYLLGSVHILPPDVKWQSPAVKKAARRADVFVFEVPQDETAQARVLSLVANKGFLPDGKSLRASLPEKDQTAFDAAIAASGLPLAAVDRERPWLAGLQMMVATMGRLKFDTANGVDRNLAAQAAAEKKPLRYLETIDDQFAVLVPDDATLEMEEFQSALKDLDNLGAELLPLVDAWSKGDQAMLDKLLNSDLDEFPAARKALLDDRNAKWLPQIEAMLKERHVFLITVGAGHLAGADGVPALLRKAGYTVEGP
jgi:uncharacterized protein YbaP (TraB family)